MLATIATGVLLLAGGESPCAPLARSLRSSVEEIERKNGLGMEAPWRILEQIAELGKGGACAVPEMRSLLRWFVKAAPAKPDVASVDMILPILKAIGPAAAAAAPEVWAVAREAGAYYRQVNEYRVEPDLETVEQAFAVLAAMGLGAVPTLVDALDKTPPEMFYSSGRPLAMIGRAAVPALMRALKDPSKRDEAAKALTQIGADASPATPALLKLCDQGSFADGDLNRLVLEMAGRPAQNWGSRAEGCALRWLKEVLPDPSDSAVQDRKVARNRAVAETWAVPFKTLAVSGIRKDETRRYAVALRRSPGIEEPGGEALRHAIDAALARRR